MGVEVGGPDRGFGSRGPWTACRRGQACSSPARHPRGASSAGSLPAAPVVARRPGSHHEILREVRPRTRRGRGSSSADGFAVSTRRRRARRSPSAGRPSPGSGEPMWRPPRRPRPVVGPSRLRHRAPDGVRAAARCRPATTRTNLRTAVGSVGGTQGVGTVHGWSRTSVGRQEPCVGAVWPSDGSRRVGP